MRLIDADELKEAMNEHTDYKGYLVCDPEEIIDLAPTVERPHGEWIPCKSTRTGQITNIDYKCSNCSHHKDRPVPYCEICGARMKRSEKK